MNRYTQQLGKWWIAALAVTALTATRADAGGIAFRNELPTPILVQGASIVNNMIRRGPPVVILPGGIALDGNLAPGPRLISIHDANQPNQVILRQTIPFQGDDLFFAVRPNPLAGQQPGVPPVVLIQQPNPFVPGN